MLYCPRCCLWRDRPSSWRDLQSHWRSSAAGGAVWETVCDFL